MGAIEDTRKLIQDFIAPELREVGANLQALADIQKTMRGDLASGLKFIRDEASAGQKTLREDFSSGLKSVRDEISAIQKTMREDLASGQKSIRDEASASQKIMREDLASGLRSIHEEISASQKGFVEGQKDMELRLLREIAKSEERISLLLKVAYLSNENAELTKRLEEKKNSPSPAQ